MNDISPVFVLPPIILALLIIAVLIILHIKKRSVLQKIYSLSDTEKRDIIDSITEAAGYVYEPSQDVFVAKLDAPQKIFGYTTFYDLSAPYFNMIFDYETIYFDYNGRTWLIEIWKGQYGINSGCELGVYYADEIIPPDRYDSTHFKSVAVEDMPDISLKLNCNHPKGRCRYKVLGHIKHKHWWLTIFKMGVYTKPKYLYVNTSIQFKNQFMLRSFLKSFEKTLPDVPYKISANTIYFKFYKNNRRYSIFKRMIRQLALMSCLIYCKLFNFITRDFIKSGDKFLFIYYYMPFIIRHMIKGLSK